MGQFAAKKVGQYQRNLQPSLPEASKWSWILWAKTAITDEIKDPVKGATIGDYYNRMPENKQTEYYWMYRILQLMIRFTPRYD